MPLPGRKKTSARRVSHAQSFTLFLFCFILLFLASFYQKYKKNSFFIVAFTCLLLVLLEWVLLRTPNCVTLQAPKTMILSALLFKVVRVGSIFLRRNRVVESNRGIPDSTRFSRQEIIHAEILYASIEKVKIVKH
jgi:hypothetical protein